MKYTTTKIMRLAGVFTAAAIFGSAASEAAPVHLKFAFISNNTELTYVTAIKPFIDNVNRDGKGIVHIDFYPNGELSRNFPQQSQIVLDGIADMAFVVPGLTPGRFPDDGVLELPGLFKNLRESTLVFTKVEEQGKLRGYNKYFVVAALGTPPYTIYSRKPIKSLRALRGLRCAVTSSIAAASLRQLGGVPVPMPVTKFAQAIGRGTVDAGLIFLSPMIDYGAIRVTNYDYHLKFGMNPVVVLMNRKKFESLPAKAQAIIRKYSGEWIAHQYAKAATARLKQLQEKIEENSKRTIVVPTASDQVIATAKFQIVDRDWLAKSPRNPGLLKVVKADLAKLR